MHIRVIEDTYINNAKPVEVMSILFCHCEKLHETQWQSKIVFDQTNKFNESGQKCLIIIFSGFKM